MKICPLPGWHRSNTLTSLQPIYGSLKEKLVQFAHAPFAISPSSPSIPAPRSRARPPYHTREARSARENESKPETNIEMVAVDEDDDGDDDVTYNALTSDERGGRKGGGERASERASEPSRRRSSVKTAEANKVDRPTVR